MLLDEDFEEDEDEEGGNQEEDGEAYEDLLGNIGEDENDFEEAF